MLLALAHLHDCFDVQLLVGAVDRTTEDQLQQTTHLSCIMALRYKYFAQFGNCSTNVQKLRNLENLLIPMEFTSGFCFS